MRIFVTAPGRMICLMALYTGSRRLIRRVGSAHPRFASTGPSISAAICGLTRMKKNIPMQNLLKKCGFSYCGRIYTSYGERIAFQRAARFILASASPRRRELVQKLPVSFLCDPARAEERVPAELPAEQTASYLAQKKAEEVFARHAKETDAVVIGADTVVLLGTERFGKPADEAEAFAMLRRLSGASHTVSTGVCIRTGSQTETFTSTTEVTFYSLSDEQICAYIATGEPMDKAGAYGIQGEGALFVKEIRGDYYTVMGLPVAALWQRLLGLGLTHTKERRREENKRE